MAIKEKKTDEFHRKAVEIMFKAVQPRNPFEDSPEKQMSKLCKDPKCLPKRKKLN